MLVEGGGAGRMPGPSSRRGWVRGGVGGGGGVGGEGGYFENTEFGNIKILNPLSTHAPPKP